MSKKSKLHDKIKIKVEGVELEFDRNEELIIDDLSSDQTRVASQMSYWGALTASAESEKIRADAYYRSWRAKIGKQILKKDPKLAEWKIKQIIESDEDFIKLKNSLAQATFNVVTCKSNFESFRTKAAQLQSRGAMMRAELDATGMTTKKEDKKRKEKKSHMKNVFSKEDD